MQIFTTEKCWRISSYKKQKSPKGSRKLSPPCSVARSKLESNWRKNSFSLRNHSTILVCELKCLLKASPAPAFQQPHICHFSFALPSIFFLFSSRMNREKFSISLNKWRSRNSKTFFTGEKFQIYDSRHRCHISYFCVLECPQDAQRLGSTYNHNVIDIVLFIFFLFFFPMCVSLCPLSPFIFRLQTKRSRNEQHLVSLRHSTFLVPKMFKQQPNTFACVFWTHSAFTSFFGQSKGNEKPFKRRQSNKWWSAPPHTMITQNILTSFDVYAFFYARPQMSFFLHRSEHIFLISSFH